MGYKIQSSFPKEGELDPRCKNPLQLGRRDLWLFASEQRGEMRYKKKKKEKRRRSFTHELTAPGERTHLETEEREVPTYAHGNVWFAYPDIHSQTHSTQTVLTQQHIETTTLMHALSNTYTLFSSLNTHFKSLFSAVAVLFPCVLWGESSVGCSVTQSL